MGLPEHAQGFNTTEFADTWLWEIIGKDHISMTFSVERAHRVPARPVPLGSPPRPFLVRLLNNHNRDLILPRVRLQKEVSFNGTKVFS